MHDHAHCIVMCQCADHFFLPKSSAHWHITMCGSFLSAKIICTLAHHNVRIISFCQNHLHIGTSQCADHFLLPKSSAHWHVTMCGSFHHNVWMILSFFQNHPHISMSQCVDHFLLPKSSTHCDVCQDRAILVDLRGPDVLQVQARREGPGSEGQGLGFNVYSEGQRSEL